MLELADYQLDAVERLKNGSILCGGVGTGKSRTGLAYYYLKECNGKMIKKGDYYICKGMKDPRQLFIITTAKKRDSCEWIKECAPFNISRVTIDSWNNIKKYSKIYGCFFIFDEQRVVGKGSWVKTFLNIARKNHWILLSATPGDTWQDYIPVFIANGFYKNRTEFNARHCIFNPYTSYPVVKEYINQGVLGKHRNDILVLMKTGNETIRHNIRIKVDYNKEEYKLIFKDRWDPFENKPIEKIPKVCYLLRKSVNSDNSRVDAVYNIVLERKKCIIFYNYEFELELLEHLLDSIGYEYAEWNGTNHDALPEGEEWCYLVQYIAGCEGWNCTSTDTIIFYSQSYSYRQTEQASGRIDRMNTSYKDLYYYHLISYAPIDLAIKKALAEKRNFNETMFMKG